MQAGALSHVMRTNSADAMTDVCLSSFMPMSASAGTLDAPWSPIFVSYRMHTAAPKRVYACPMPTLSRPAHASCKAFNMQMPHNVMHATSTLHLSQVL